MLNEIVRPGRTRLAQRWIEDGKFLGFTCDFETAKGEERVFRMNRRGGEEGGTYCNSVENIELMILTQGFNSYNHTRSHSFMAGYGMRTPQVATNGRAVAELNSIPTFKNATGI